MTKRTLDKIPVEEARAIQSKGGIASGVANRRRKYLRELLSAALELQAKSAGGKPVTDGEGHKLTNAEASMLSLAQKSAGGDIKAIRLTAEMLGELQLKIEQVQSEQVGDFDPVEALKKIYQQ